MQVLIRDPHVYICIVHVWILRNVQVTQAYTLYRCFMKLRPTGWKETSEYSAVLYM